MTKNTYHHGNLSDELVLQAIKLLENEGLGTLSLRRVAKEAGVSQAAPYSHFKNKKSLMSAVAVEGYRRFEQKMREGRERESTDILGLGMGYVMFALENPALFQLMFSADLVNLIDVDKDSRAFGTSYELLVDTVRQDPLVQFGEHNPEFDSMFLWSLVHGLAKLILAKRIEKADYQYESDESMVREMLEKYLLIL